jgi:hypothetical protein
VGATGGWTSDTSRRAVSVVFVGAAALSLDAVSLDAVSLAAAALSLWAVLTGAAAVSSVPRAPELQAPWTPNRKATATIPA